jgi:hypothetical protein
MREVVGILHNLTDMCQKASACIGLYVGMVPELYHCLLRLETRGECDNFSTIWSENATLILQR